MGKLSDTLQAVAQELKEYADAIDASEGQGKELDLVPSKCAQRAITAVHTLMVRDGVVE